MASRGIWHFMSARTRWSLALSWTALFALSLLLQYFSLAMASPALTTETAASNQGFTLMLVLLGLAGPTLTIGFVTPTPERVRRRDRQG